MAGLVAVIYGIVAYGFTLVALLYLIGFSAISSFRSRSIQGRLDRFSRA